MPGFLVDSHKYSVSSFHMEKISNLTFNIRHFCLSCATLKNWGGPGNKATFIQGTYSHVYQLKIMQVNVNHFSWVSQMDNKVQVTTINDQCKVIQAFICFSIFHAKTIFCMKH